MAELTISQIWRYPVKSLGGEQLDEVEVTDRGIVGDRGWGIRQLDTGNVLTARRRPELLFASAAVIGGELVITLPDGVTIDAGTGADPATVDAALSAWLNEPVSLVAAGDEAGTYETPIDAEAEDAAPWVSWSGPTGSFHDSTKSRLSLVSQANLRDWDIRRFRTNLVLDGTGEDDLIGSSIRLGEQAELVINKAIDRCVMVTRPQPGLERDLDVLRTISRERESCLSIGGNVLTGGTIRIGDSVQPLPT